MHSIARVALPLLNHNLNASLFTDCHTMRTRHAKYALPIGQSRIGYLVSDGMEVDILFIVISEDTIGDWIAIGIYLQQTKL